MQTKFSGISIIYWPANASGHAALSVDHIKQLSSEFRNNSNAQCTKRTYAHRQTWFSSNALNLTSQSRNERTLLYFIRGADDGAGVVIFNLVDTDTMLSREFVAKEFKSAEEKAQEPSPIQEINELMRLSNIPIEISIERKQKTVARRNGGELYSVAELSDRERIAFLFDTEVFTTPPSSLVLIDEPECHLHRSTFPHFLLYCYKRNQIVPSLYQLLM